MSGTTKPMEESDVDRLIENTLDDWHHLKNHLKGEGVGK